MPNLETWKFQFTIFELEFVTISNETIFRLIVLFFVQKTSALNFSATLRYSMKMSAVSILLSMDDQNAGFHFYISFLSFIFAV